jgi:hypothetical protein
MRRFKVVESDRAIAGFGALCSAGAALSAFSDR